MCLYRLKSAKKTHLFRLICETGYCNGILTTCFGIGPWKSITGHRDHYFRLVNKGPVNSHTVLYVRDAGPGIAFEEGMPAFVHLDDLNVIKLILAHSEFSSCTQMNALFLEKNKTSPIFTMALTCMPVLKIRLLLVISKKT